MKEMTNDAAVAWVVVDQTLRKDSPDPNFMDGAYWTRFETVSADRALSVVKERQSIRPTGKYEVVALVPATTVAELRAEVERLTEQLRYVADACEHETARADAAERRVAECLKFIAGVRDELHNRRTADWYPEGAHNAAEQMSEDMRLIGNACADFDPYAEKDSP